MYKYNIFGLKVTSEFKLNCYSDEFVKPDVQIKLNQATETNKVKSENSFIRFDLIKATIKVNNVGLFHVTEGREIVIEAFQHNCDGIELYLLGTIFGVLMLQRKEFPLHGSTVYNGGKTITFVGHSGAGKTTLAAGLVQKGWKILTDDVSRITTFKGNHIVNPSYPSQKVWENSISKLNLAFKLEDATKVESRMNKYYYTDNDRFLNKATKLNAIFEIKAEPCESVKISKLKSRESFEILLSNTYKYELIKQTQLTGDHFKYISSLSNSIDVYRLSRPIGEFTISDQIKIIEKYLMEKYDGDSCAI